MFVGGGSGFREDIPFSSRGVGEEFNEQYLPLCQMTRDDCYVTNVVKCYDPKTKSDLAAERLHACARVHLRDEIRTLEPSTVVLMGGDAASMLTYPDVAEPCMPEFSIELEHGRLWQGMKLFGHKCEVITTLHPALGMHSTNSIREIREDFARWVNVGLSGIDDWPRDVMAGRYEFAVATAENDYAFELPTDGYPIAIDSELYGLDQFADTIWCLTYSTADNNGWMIRAGDTEALGRFRSMIKRQKVIYHKSTFDGPVMERLGTLDLLEDVEFVDTMILLYDLGNYGVNQSLKTTSYRELGVRMREFDDLVRPYAKVALLEYLTQRAVFATYPKPEGRKKSIDSRIKTFIKACTDTTRTLKDKSVIPVVPRDPLTKWNAWDKEVKEAIQAAAGLAPKLTIDLAPFEEALIYACLDANTTRRNYKILEKRVREWTPDTGRKVARADVDD
jgi:uracil-DNA glycosylase family 4